MESNGPDADNPLWSFASRTVRADDAGEDLKQLALRHHREPLRQYLALRLGSEEAAREALASIGVRVSGWETAQLTATPGPRAQLFRLAREYLQEQGVETGPSAAFEHTLQFGADAASGIRQLGPERAELLELHHARELSPVEIAHVLKVGVGEVTQSLAAAESAGASALGATPASLPLAAARTFAATPDPEVHAVETGGQSLPSGTVIGERYTIDKAVGIGAFGQVYRATDNLVEGHAVALKLLHQPARSEEERQAALRELRLIASVFHPSIVSFKDHGWYDGRFWFVMPWYDGEPLENRIEREPLRREEALRIFTPLAQALASMHAAGVRHQDIKPENIFLAELKTDPLGEEQLQPVLLDLGVAATDADSLVAGTPAYFAPEVAAACTGEAFAPITDKADVFSLALALRNALEPETAQQVQGTAVQMFIAFRAQEVPPPPQGKELAFLRPHFARWMARDPEARPTAAAFAAELAVLLEPERRAKKRAAFLGWFVPVVAAFLVFAAGGAFVWSQQMREQENRAHAAELEARNAELARRREAMLRASLEEEHGELQVKQAETQKAHDELADALQDTEAEAEKLENRAGALARARRNAARELAATEEELGDLSKQAEELQLSKSQLEARVDDLNGRVRKLLDQAKSLDGLLEDNRELLAKEQAHAEGLRRRLNKAEGELTDLQKRFDNVEKQRDKRKAERDEARAQLERKQKELIKRDDEIAKLNGRIEQLEKNVKKLRKDNKKLRESQKKGK